MNNLWQKTTALHDRIDIRLFDEEWDRRRVKHEKKLEPVFTMVERWLPHQLRGLNQEEMFKYQWLAARLQQQQQQQHFPPRLTRGLGGVWSQIFGSCNWGYPAAMQKCPHCGR